MRQLIKFCLVGLSSTILSQGILYILLRAFPLFHWSVLGTISFIFGVTNGFFWNRRWTFRSQDSSASRQFSKFIATNVIGLVFNLFITKIFLVILTRGAVPGSKPDPDTVQIASLMTIPIVVIWNFSAARFWTFKKPKQPVETTLNAPPIVEN